MKILMRNKVIKSVNIDINHYHLWEIISSPKKLHFYHPFCKKNEVLTWDRENTVDLIEYFNGKVLKRKFFVWNERTGYKLIINDLKKDLAEVHWNLSDAGENKSILSIQVKVLKDALKKFPNYINKIILEMYILPNLGAYLDSVLMGIKFYSERGKKVSKNQFGYNSMFSS